MRGVSKEIIQFNETEAKHEMEEEIVLFLFKEFCQDMTLMVKQMKMEFHVV